MSNVHNFEREWPAKSRGMEYVSITASSLEEALLLVEHVDDGDEIVTVREDIETDGWVLTDGNEG